MFSAIKRWLASLFKPRPKPQPAPSDPKIPNSGSIPTRPSQDLKLGFLGTLKPGAKGVDISHHNANVDLDELCRNTDFIYMKATEGRTFVSKAYESRAVILRKKDTPWGAYHYYRINADPTAQAKHFCKFKEGWTLPPVLDIEAISNDGYSAAKHTAGLLQFLEYVEKEVGMTPVVYTGFYFARDDIKPTKEFGRYPLWLAWYTQDFSRVKAPWPWQAIKIWQYTEHGRNEGVVGNVDLNKIVS